VASDHPIMLFDGVCNLCSGSVQFIIRHDPKGRFRFASLQSEAARRLGEEHGFDPADLDTVVLIEKGRVYTKSDAAVRIARRLRGSARHWYAARHLPRPLRDALYDVVARNRYRWFGQKAECMAPTSELRAPFLDDDVAVPGATLNT
jgi:predicted DCC family thiol-disulfide oxidoreductase YuxK